MADDDKTIEFLYDTLKGGIELAIAQMKSLEARGAQAFTVGRCSWDWRLRDLASTEFDTADPMAAARLAFEQGSPHRTGRARARRLILVDRVVMCRPGDSYGAVLEGLGAYDVRLELW